MTSYRFIPLLMVLTSAADADTLRVGPGEIHSGIQSAIDAAQPGDTIEVKPGSYHENVVINKSPLTLLGTRWADDARGRVTSTPESHQESIIIPANGKGIEISSSTGAVTVSGFSIIASGATGGAVGTGSTGTTNLVFTNNYVSVTPGTSGPAFRLGHVSADATVSGNVFIAATTSEETVVLSGGNAFNGFHFLNNHVLREGTVGHKGFVVDGDRNVAGSATRSPLIQGNLFQGHGTAFAAGSRSLRDARISSNVFDGNERGFVGGPIHSQIEDNLYGNNTVYGIQLTGASTTDASHGASNTTVRGNDFTGNGTDILLDDQADGTQATNTIERNRFSAATAIHSNEPTGQVRATHNFWNASSGPGGTAPGTGSALTGPGAVSFLPYYSDAAFRSLVYGTAPLSGSVTLEAGESIQGEQLVLAPSANLVVPAGATVKTDRLELQGDAKVDSHGGSLVIGKLQMAPDAVLDVVNGDLSLDPLASGDFHTISGSFTFFNSLGSLDINANTTFSGNTLGIASDIHVAPNVSLFVLGSLSLDGCRLQGPAPYNLLVNIGASFRMARCEVSNASINIVGNDALIHDNHFTNSSVAAFSTVNGASIYHNIFSGTGSASILPGATVTTNVEGWGNVSSEAAVINQLDLGFRPPSDPTRTLDASGNLFVQPGDPVDVRLDVSKLNHKAQAVEAMLGYSTDHLQYDSLLPSATWTNDLHESSEETGVIGRFNTAVGLGFAFPDPDGTSTDGTVADIRMETTAAEGQTRFFFRTKNSTDNPMAGTRITGSSAGIPFFKNFPFTSNSGTITIDGTAPTFGPAFSAVQTRNAVVHDVLQSGVLTRSGQMILTFDAQDQLAGIDPTDASISFTSGLDVLTATLAGSSVVDISGVPHTRFVFHLDVNATTPDGIYDVDASVMDRSGNVATLAIGTVEVVKNRVLTTVAPQSLTTAPIVRNVVFTATNSSGGILETWTLPVSFTGGSGMVAVNGIPTGTAFLSAKTAWNLRVRLPVILDANGDGAVSFTGSSQLRGGDFNGDNVVNFNDHNIIRVNYPGINPATDITGDGVSNFTDYNVFRANWLTGGDAH